MSSRVGSQPSDPSLIADLAKGGVKADENSSASTKVKIKGDQNNVQINLQNNHYGGGRLLAIAAGAGAVGLGVLAYNKIFASDTDGMTNSRSQQDHKPADHDHLDQYQKDSAPKLV